MEVTPTVEQELRTFLSSNLKEGTNRERDIEVVAYYYGFGDSIWPTLEDTANRFDIGKTRKDSPIAFLPL